MSDPIKAVVVDEEDQQQPVVDSPAGRVSSASAVGEETPVPASEAIEELAPSRQLQADTVKASAQADTESTAPEAVPTGSLIDFDAPVESVITPAFSRPDVVSSSSAVIVPHLLSPSKTPILLPSANTTSLSQAPPPSPCDMSSTSSTLPSDTTTDPFGELSERDLTGISRAFPAPSSPKTSSPSQTHLQILAQLDQEVAKLGEDVDKLDLEQKERQRQESQLKSEFEPQIETVSQEASESTALKEGVTLGNVPGLSPAEEDDELEEVTISSSSEGKSAIEVAPQTTALPPTTVSPAVSSPSSSQTQQTPLVDLGQEYHLKWIKWKGNSKLPIVTQNANGPCPLIAIINVLLLRKNITFPPMVEIISAQQLMEYLCDFLLNNVPTNLPEQVKLDYEANLQDAVNMLPRLSTGLDVNVRFTDISEFEYTSECIIFDLLRIPLYHGWLVNPIEAEVLRVVKGLTYNQLVDRIITNKGSTDPGVNSETFIAEEFLSQSASQLTNYGLDQLIQRLKEDELCILFRNNHFITLYKCKGKLFQLVTDQGFLGESSVVWESFDNIEGDTSFLDGDFLLVPPKPAIALSPTNFVPNTQQQIDQDYLIALSLEQEQKAEWERAAESSDAQTTVLPNTPTGTSTASGVTTVIPVSPPVTIFESSKGTTLSDEEIARQLQAEEQAAYKRTQEARERSKQAGQMVAQAQPGAMSANRRSAQQQPQQGSHNARYGRNVVPSTTTPRAANTGGMNHHGEQHHRSGGHHQGSTNRDPASHHGSRHGSQSNEGASHHPTSGGEHPHAQRSAAGTRPPPEDDADSRRDSRSKNCSIM